MEGYRVSSAGWWVWGFGLGFVLGFSWLGSRSSGIRAKGSELFDPEIFTRVNYVAREKGLYSAVFTYF